MRKYEKTANTVRKEFETILLENNYIYTVDLDLLAKGLSEIYSSEDPEVCENIASKNMTRFRRNAEKSETKLTVYDRQGEISNPGFVTATVQELRAMVFKGSLRKKAPKHFMKFA